MLGEIQFTPQSISPQKDQGIPSFKGHVLLLNEMGGWHPEYSYNSQTEQDKRILNTIIKAFDNQDGYSAKLRYDYFDIFVPSKSSLKEDYDPEAFPPGSLPKEYKDPGIKDHFHLTRFGNGLLVDIDRGKCSRRVWLRPMYFLNKDNIAPRLHESFDKCMELTKPKREDHYGDLIRKTAQIDVVKVLFDKIFNNI